MLLLILPFYQNWIELHTRAFYVDPSVLVGALLLYPVIYILTQACTTIATSFYNTLDPPPPWNLNHMTILYFPRHY
jgi:hypothetical protein